MRRAHGRGSGPGHHAHGDLVVGAGSLDKAVVWKPAAFSPATTVGAQSRDSGQMFRGPRRVLPLPLKRSVCRPRQEGPDDLHPSMAPLQDALAGPAKNASLMFMGAVVLVLLIACTNVANILTARTADRISEFSIRSALGASGGRLARQLFTESLLLSLVATLGGFGIAYWIISLAAKVAPPTLAAQSYSVLDARVLAFTVIISIVTALTFSILPSLYLGRVHGLRTRSSSRPYGSRVVREILVGTQVMLTIILLAGSVSLGRAFDLMKIDRGYDVKDVVTVGVSLDGTTHQLDKRPASLLRRGTGPDSAASRSS